MAGHAVHTDSRVSAQRAPEDGGVYFLYFWWKKLFYVLSMDLCTFFMPFLLNQITLTGTQPAVFYPTPHGTITSFRAELHGTYHIKARSIWVLAGADTDTDHFLEYNMNIHFNWLESTLISQICTSALRRVQYSFTAFLCRSSCPPALSHYISGVRIKYLWWQEVLQTNSYN